LQFPWVLTVHAPLVQVSPMAHARPHFPQLLESIERLVQPFSHRSLPFLQASPAFGAVCACAQKGKSKKAKHRIARSGPEKLVEVVAAVPCIPARSA
jgi:hypothetical protein